MCRNRFFVPNPSHFNDFIPIPIGNLNPIPIFPIDQFPILSHLATQPWHPSSYEYFYFLQSACLCWPPSNGVSQIKESKWCSDQMNWQHPKNEMSTAKNEFKCNYCLLQVLASYSMQWFFPLPRLNSYFPHTLIPFSSHGWSYSHSHGNPMDGIHGIPVFLILMHISTVHTILLQGAAEINPDHSPLLEKILCTGV